MFGCSSKASQAKKRILSTQLRLWGICALALILLEIGIRAFGAGDYPLYYADNSIGYIPAKSQVGSFLNKNQWAFNDLSMGTSERFSSSSNNDVLLIGDSVVLGGNSISQADKLGPQLEKINALVTVWPISAGSWSIRNELEYLRQHKDVAFGVEKIVFIVNSADFVDKPSEWRNPLTHPVEKPMLLSWYLLEKYVISRIATNSYQSTADEFRIISKSWVGELESFLKSNRHKDIVFYLYPDMKEMANHDFLALEDKGQLILSLSDTVKVYSLGRDARWTSSLYRDSIHPNPKGYKLLAIIINSPSYQAYL